MNSGQLAAIAPQWARTQAGPVIASFWVWVAVMGVYGERKAGPAAVAKMEELSAKEGMS
jgi:hypothetical protein